MGSYQPLNTLGITLNEKKFLPLDSCFLQPLPHVGGSLAAPVLMNEGHPVHRPALHQGEEVEERPNVAEEPVEEDVESVVCLALVNKLAELFLQ